MTPNSIRSPPSLVARTCPICGAAPAREFKPRALTVQQCGNHVCGHVYAKHLAPDQGVQTGRDHAPKARRTGSEMQAWWTRG